MMLYSRNQHDIVKQFCSIKQNRSGKIMDFKWFVNCKAHHKSYHRDLLFYAVPEREICFWPVEMAWVKEVPNDG